MKVALGCDVGGTRIKSGLFSEDGVLLARRSADTPALVSEDSYQVVIALFRDMLREAGLSSSDVLGVGLDTPGSVLEDGTHLLHYNIDINLPELRRAITTAFPHAATAVLNDGNAAAAGEFWQGAGQNSFNCCTLVLGTGVGGGVVAGGKLISGAHGCAGEIGHICVNPDEDRRCTCGKRGCTELYASATGLIRSYREACEAVGVQPVDVSDGALAVFNAYEAGDEQARIAVDIMSEMLARCLAATAGVLDPDLFIIGGGMAGAFELFADMLIERYQIYVNEGAAETPIVPAQLGNDAGIYGAAYQVLTKR